MQKWQQRKTLNSSPSIDTRNQHLHIQQFLLKNWGLNENLLCSLICTNQRGGFGRAKVPRMCFTCALKVEGESKLWCFLVLPTLERVPALFHLQGPHRDGQEKQRDTVLKGPHPTPDAATCNRVGYVWRNPVTYSPALRHIGKTVVQGHLDYTWKKPTH